MLKKTCLFLIISATICNLSALQEGEKLSIQNARPERFSPSLASNNHKGRTSLLDDYNTIMQYFKPLRCENRLKSTITQGENPNAQGVLKCVNQAHFSLFNLAKAYSEGGDEIEKNPKLVTWLRRAAEQGLAEAQYILGIAYYYGMDANQDDEQIAPWWQKVAKLINSYIAEEKAQPNFTQTIFWWQKAAEQDFAEAHACLGNAYFFGEGVEKNDAMAFIHWEKAAQQGVPGAQHNVACVYSLGIGVPKDDPLAAAWEQKAAAQDFGEAQLELHYAYLEGKGVMQDDTLADFWYNRFLENPSIGEPTYNSGADFLEILEQVLKEVYQASHKN